MKHISLMGSLWLLVACAHSSQERFDGALKPWIGRHPDELVTAWGAPRSTYTLENGRKVLTYEESAFVSRTFGAYTFPRPEVFSYSDSCKLSIFTDSQQKVIDSYSYTGSLSVCLEWLESTRRSSQRATGR